jgi:AraC-like DNA-binding protein
LPVSSQFDKKKPVKDSIYLLDFGMRFSAVIVMLLIAAIVSVSKAKIPLKISTSLMVMGGIGYLLAASPYIYTHAEIMQPVLKFCSQTAVLWFWFFALTLFDDPVPKRLLWWQFVLFTAMWALMWVMPERRDLIIIPHHTLSVLLIMHVIWLAISGLRDDLIEGRRRLRIWLVISIGLIVFSISFSIDGSDWTSLQINWRLYSSLAILGAATFAGFSLLGIDQNLIVNVVNGNTALEVNELSPSERVLKEKLNQYMESGFYMTSGLTVRTFATELDVPDHKLRALINGKLGYTNFSAFLNHYRIEKAKEQLAHPDFVDVQIFTLAMDLGYGSLAPFNRAFRENTGMSPSDFREKAIA